MLDVRGKGAAAFAYPRTGSPSRRSPARCPTGHDAEPATGPGRSPRAEQT